MLTGVERHLVSTATTRGRHLSTLHVWQHLNYSSTWKTTELSISVPSLSMLIYRHSCFHLPNGNLLIAGWKHWDWEIMRAGSHVRTQVCVYIYNYIYIYIYLCVRVCECLWIQLHAHVLVFMHVFLLVISSSANLICAADLQLVNHSHSVHRYR